MSEVLGLGQISGEDQRLTGQPREMGSEEAIKLVSFRGGHVRPLRFPRLGHLSNTLAGDVPLRQLPANFGSLRFTDAQYHPLDAIYVFYQRFS
jgi:hypothetical protein